MCGIAGWYNASFAKEERLSRLQAMCKAIRHRGPDENGFFVSPDAALGMQRLSIVDIEGGSQPMYGADGAVALVFNGEIYNHAALRRELEEGGSAFRSAHSDTEVLLEDYLRHGLGGLSRLNGMFALAIWDNRNRTLHLARDRMGVKPLYYYYDGKCLFFASEIKAILAVGAFVPEPNLRAVWDYLSFRYVPAPQTIWKNIYKLPPAHSLSICDDGQGPCIRRWWDIPYRYPSRAIGWDEAESEFTALLDDAVDLRMVADVPVGILLSGGLDSSTVAALAARHSPRPIKTFSVAFENTPEIDERSFAREVAQRLHTDHHEVLIGQREFQDTLSDLVYFTDEPLADLASVPLFHVCRLAREQVKVVLSGEGSDEILGGYDFELSVKRWQEKRRRKGIGRLLDIVVPLPDEDMRCWAVPFNMTNYLSPENKTAMFLNGSFPDSMQSLRERLSALGKQDILHQTLYCFCQDWLTEDLLMKADRMSMAVSLELRTPFLDYRVIEWAASVPAAFKAGQDINGVWKNKLVLRRMAEKLLPESVLTRTKQGFPVPVYDWLAGSMKNFAYELLGARARIGKWFCRDAIDAALATGTAKESGILDKHRLWNLMILEIWAERWKP
jgi:asparagine synthase (glutamine-hydrolysing)